MSNVLEIVPMTDAMDYHIHRDARSDQAWDFSNGDPEIYQYSDRLIVPGQRVLDLGCGALRASALFALHAPHPNRDAGQAVNVAPHHHRQRGSPLLNHPRLGNVFQGAGVV